MIALGGWECGERGWWLVLETVTYEGFLDGVLFFTTLQNGEFLFCVQCFPHSPPPQELMQKALDSRG